MPPPAPALAPAVVGVGFEALGLGGLGFPAEGEESPEMGPKSWSQEFMLFPKAGLPPGTTFRTPAVGAGVPAIPGLPEGRKAEACGLSFVPEPVAVAVELEAAGLLFTKAASIEARIFASDDMAFPPVPPAADEAEAVEAPAFFAAVGLAGAAFAGGLAGLALRAFGFESEKSSSLSEAAASRSLSEAASIISSSLSSL